MLVEHAKREMELAHLFDADADYDGDVAKSVMELMTVFAAQGHSGESAAQTIDLFTRLAKFENLTPMTDDPAEWEEVTELNDGKRLWQSKRNPKVFSTNGGKSWYFLKEGE